METTTTERVDADLSTPDVAIRILATAGDADQRYPVPSKQRFKDAGEGVIEADDLEHIARALIADDNLPLGHLAALRIGYLWADRGGSTGGFPCFGRLIKASKALLHYAEIDYLVMLSADHLRDAKATRWQVEALIGHQLGHVEMLTTEKGEDRYSVKGHDFEGFSFEFKRWGAYLPGMVAPAQSAASAVQMGMVWEAGDIEDDLEDDYDPSVDQAAGVEDEIGPEPDGEPKVDWAETFKDDPDAYDAFIERASADLLGTPDDEPNDDTHDPETGEVRPGFDAKLTDAHRNRVRMNFWTVTIDDGIEVCKACGLDIDLHHPEVCAGGTPETKQRRRHKSPKNRSGAEVTDSERLDVSDEPGRTEPLNASGAVSSNGTNGSHDPADVAGHLLDPDRVMATLSEAGWSIAYLAHQRDGGGLYVNPKTGDPHDTDIVEAAYRAAIAGRRS